MTTRCGNNSMQKSCAAREGAKDLLDGMEAFVRWSKFSFPHGFSVTSSWGGGSLLYLARGPKKK